MHDVRQCLFSTPFTDMPILRHQGASAKGTYMKIKQDPNECPSQLGQPSPTKLS